MSSDVPVQVVVAAFQDEQAAQQVLAKLKEAKKAGVINIVDVAVLTKDAKGKLHIKESADMKAGKGAVIGGVAGAVVGLLAGPVGWMTVGGAAVGALAAKLHDGGFKDDRLKKLGEGLKPGNAAIVAVVEHVWVAKVQAALAEAGADAVTEDLSADIAKQLGEGGEVAYTAVDTGDAVAAGRVAASDQAVSAAGVVATADGVAAEGVKATKDSVTGGAAVVTDQGAAAIGGSVKVEGDDAKKA